VFGAVSGEAVAVAVVVGERVVLEWWSPVARVVVLSFFVFLLSHV
jgi:hypothetical protein